MGYKSIGAENLVRHLAGPYAERILAIFFEDNIVDFLTADTARQHVWYAWVSTRAEGSKCGPENLPFLNFEKNETILRKAFGECPPGLGRVFGKLGVQACREETYADLFLLMKEQSGRSKYLQHAAEISEIDVSKISVLAPEICSAPILDQLESVMGAAAFTRACQKAIERNPNLSLRTIERALRKRTRSDFYEALEGLVLQGLSFGRAPLQYSSLLRPIENAKQLKRLGYKYRNCLRSNWDYAKSVASRRSYFYEWLGGDGAVIQVTNDLVLGWILDEVKGPDNKPLESSEIERIAAALGISAHVDCGWGDDISSLIDRNRNLLEEQQLLRALHPEDGDALLANEMRLFKEVKESLLSEGEYIGEMDLHDAVEKAAA